MTDIEYHWMAPFPLCASDNIDHQHVCVLNTMHKRFLSINNSWWLFLTQELGLNSFCFKSSPAFKANHCRIHILINCITKPAQDVFYKHCKSRNLILLSLSRPTPGQEIKCFPLWLPVIHLPVHISIKGIHWHEQKIKTNTNTNKL